MPGFRSDEELELFERMDIERRREEAELGAERKPRLIEESELPDFLNQARFLRIFKLKGELHENRANTHHTEKPPKMWNRYTTVRLKLCLKIIEATIVHCTLCSLHKFHGFKGFTVVKSPCWKKKYKVAHFGSGNHFDKFQLNDCPLYFLILAKRLFYGCGTVYTHRWTHLGSISKCRVQRYWINSLFRMMTIWRISRPRRPERSWI